MRWKNGLPVMADVLAPRRHGKAELEKFVVRECDFRARFYDHMQIGEEYALLTVNGEVMMSDTPMERESNQMILEKAHGHVLIGGLGLGMVPLALQEKPEVKRITVIEKNMDVLNLVGSQLYLGGHLDGKIEIIHDDVFAYPGYGGLKYNTIYMDIWPNYGKHLKPEMEELRKKYTPMLHPKDPDAWFGCWQEEVAFGNEHDSGEEEKYYFG